MVVVAAQAARDRDGPPAVPGPDRAVPSRATRPAPDRTSPGVATTVLTASRGSGSVGFSAWVAAGVALLVAVVLALVARWLVRRRDRRRNTTTTSVQVVARLVFVVVVTVGVYVALRIVGLDLGPVLGGAGIVGIALAFALRDIAENLISGILMGLRNPFTPGDEIVSGEHTGVVEELNLRHTSIRTPEGARVLLPNGKVLSSPLTKLTVNGHRRSEFSVGVAFGTDLGRAQVVATGALADVGEVHREPPPEAWVEELAPSWVTLRARFWHASRTADHWRVRSAAIVAVAGAMERTGVEMPFERTVVDVVRPDGRPAGPTAP